MILKEIGSEFWLEDKKEIANDSLKYFNIGMDNKFLLSGRTAIDFVLEDILKVKKIKNVYFPSYCCNSMLKPFVEKKINIEFYDVKYDKELFYNIDLNKKCDVFFAMNYFGYTSTNMDKYIKKFKEKNAIIIEDITHSLLSNKSHSNYSDYLVASLRKWFPVISGGLAIAKNRKFLIMTKDETNYSIINEKEKAMILKHDYMLNEKKMSKKLFLRKYEKSNKILEEDYRLYPMDRNSLEILKKSDINFIKKRRIENSKVIQKRLKDTDVKFLIPNLQEGDCLLFVPIIIDKEKKEKIKKLLINNNIYCPTHWPKPDMVKNSDLYETEMSLVCDQRYSKDEVKKYIDLIVEFMKEI